MKSNNYPHILTFKVNSELLKTLSTLQNRSEFIREAIYTALSQRCESCGGTGVKPIARQE